MKTELHSEQPKIGDVVIFFDQFGMEHNALLTNVFGERRITTFKEEGAENVTEQVSNPAVNVLLVSPDKQREDSYGRQIERQTSCSHYSSSSAWGNFWCMPSEIVAAREACAKHKAQYTNSK